MNILLISGNLTKDCVIRATPGGKTVCNFTVAVNEGYEDNKRTEYYECSIWGKRAEGKLPQYLIKGQKVFISGDPRQDERTHEGNKYFAVKVFVDKIELLGSGAGSESASKSGAQASGDGGPSSAQAVTNDFDDDPFNDSIPF